MPEKKSQKKFTPRSWVFTRINFSVPEDVAFYIREIAKTKPRGWQSEVVVKAFRTEIEKK
jgi:hypothetical protein